MRKHRQRPKNKDYGTALRKMPILNAIQTGHTLRWNTAERQLEINNGFAGWRTVRQLADWNRRVEWTRKFIAARDASIARAAMKRKVTH